MTPVTQILLLISYAILGVAVMTLPPRLFGWDAQLSGYVGMLVFFGGWQLQNWIMNRRFNEDAADRLSRLEDVTHILRKDLERARRELASRGREGEVANEKMVGELKMLQTLLTQVNVKELELKGGGSATAPKVSDADAFELSADHSPIEGDAAEGTGEDTEVGELEFEREVDEEITAEDIEELGLTAEEAALVVMQPNEPPADVAGGKEIQVTAAPTTAAAADDDMPAPKAAPRGRKALAPKRKAPIRIIKREDQLLSVVKSALSENRVDLYLQPIVSLPARRTVHFECFSRVRDENGSVILPRQYMKIAESKGLIGTIDNLLLFRLIQLVRRLGKRRPDLRFFCNMSRYSMADEEFFPQFIDFMTSNEEFSRRLVFEISQEDFNVLDDDVLDRLETLGRRGFGFSMDGVANFEQEFANLERYNFQFLKTDLRDLLGSHPERGDVADFKSFVRRKGMQLIASRIESEEGVLKALEAQVEYAQGYLFGEPAAAGDLAKEL